MDKNKFTKIRISLALCLKPISPALNKLKEEDGQSESNLGYTVSSRPAWVLWRPWAGDISVGRVFICLAQSLASTPNCEKLDIVVPVCNLSTWEVKAGGFSFQGTLGYTVSLRPACNT